MLSEPVVLGLITFFQVVTVAALGVLSAVLVAKINRVQRDAVATRDSVVNHHDRPMRYDLDDNHEELKRFMRSQAHVNFEVDMKLDHLVNVGQENRRRISSLEDTQVSDRNRKDGN